MHVRDSSGRLWVLNDDYTINKFFETFGLDPNVDPLMYQLLQYGLGPISKKYHQWMDTRGILEEAQNTGDYTKAQGDLASQGIELGADQEKWLENMISQQNVQQDQQYQTGMRDTALTSAAGQLQSLGLSTSNIIQTGGAASGVSSTPAATSHHSVASLKQQARLNQYNQNMGMAKSIIGMAGSMASSGIYGAALGATKNAAAKLAAATAHSGLNVLKHHTSQKMTAKDNALWDSMMKELGY